MLKQVASVEKALHRMQCAVLNGRGGPYCLRLWGQFIKLRDGNRCVACHTKRNLAAHHILRKSFLSEARFQTGNGITLCNSCHRESHKAFNRKPNLELPMDAEGGENIELLTAFFDILLSDAKRRHLLRDDFYYT